MPTAKIVDTAIVPAFIPPPKVDLTFRILREGEVTPGRKVVFGFRKLGDSGVAMAFESPDGEFTTVRRFDLATLLNHGDWVVTGTDYVLPRLAATVFADLSLGGTVTLNLSSGSGGGDPGEPGVVGALVRVDGADVARDVVIVERQLDGEWRVAGFRPVSAGGEPVEVRTLGGRMYALAADDYGIAFTPLLAVTPGLRIRPTDFRGWLYEITEGGTLPGEEPSWWPMDGQNASRPLGSARAVAVRYYRPLAHGPITVEMT